MAPAASTEYPVIQEDAHLRLSQEEQRAFDLASEEERETAVTWFFKLTKGTGSVHFFKGDLGEQHADDNDDDAFKIESSQPVSDTFCEPVSDFSRLLQLEHHQCVRLLKAVCGLVNAPRRWYRGVATDLRNMGAEESLIEPCLWTFRDENCVIQALCLVNVDGLHAGVQ